MQTSETLPFIEISDEQKSIFREAITNNSSELVDELLKANAGLASVLYEDNDTPLHLAASKCSAGVVNLLVGHGANPDAKNEDDETPLHFTFAKVDLESAKILLEQKSKSLLFRNSTGDTPIQSLIFHADYPEKKPQLIELCQQKKIEVFEAPVFEDAFSGNTTGLSVFLDKHKINDIKDANGYTLLHYAAAHNQTKTIKFLMDSGANVNEQNKFGYTPLHIAAENGHFELMQALIENGANTELNAEYDITHEDLKNKYLQYHPIQSNKPFFISPLQTLRPSIADYIKKNLNIIKINEDKEIQQALIAAILDQDINILVELYRYKFDFKISRLFANMWLTPLQISIFFSGATPKNIVSLLTIFEGGFEAPFLEQIYYGEVKENDLIKNRDFTDSNGFTLMHYAAANNQCEIMKKLLKIKPNLVKNFSKTLDTPLHIAVINGHSQAIKLLLKNEADVEAINSQKNTPIDLIEIVLDEVLKKEIYAAFGIDHSIPQQNVKVKDPAPAPNENELLLIMAIRDNNLEIFNFCLTVDLPIRFNIKEPITGQTLLHIVLACEQVNEEMFTIILEQKETDVNAVDSENNTPLHLAVTKRLVNGVKQLLEKGANPLLPNSQGQTALQLAEAFGYKEILEIFQSTKPFHQENPSAWFPNKKKRSPSEKTSSEQESENKKAKVGSTTSESDFEQSMQGPSEFSKDM